MVLFFYFCRFDKTVEVIMERDPFQNCWHHSAIRQQNMQLCSHIWCMWQMAHKQYTIERCLFHNLCGSSEKCRLGRSVSQVICERLANRKTNDNCQTRVLYKWVMTVSLIYGTGDSCVMSHIHWVSQKWISGQYSYECTFLSKWQVSTSEIYLLNIPFVASQLSSLCHCGQIHHPITGKNSEKLPF